MSSRRSPGRCWTWHGDRSENGKPGGEEGHGICLQECSREGHRKRSVVPLPLPRVFQKACSFVTVEDEGGSVDSSPEIEIRTMCRYICVCTHIHRHTYIHIDRTPVHPQLHRLPATRRTNPFTSTNPYPVYHRRAQEQHGQPAERRQKRNKGGGKFIPGPDG